MNSENCLKGVDPDQSLDKRYIAIFLDGLFFFLRRDTVEKEPRIRCS